MSYRIKAPLVITKNENGSDLYLYQGAPLPSHVKADEIKRLQADDMLEELPDGEADKPARSSAKK
jgi:hypothetical protein